MFSLRKILYDNSSLLNWSVDNYNHQVPIILGKLQIGYLLVLLIMINFDRVYSWYLVKSDRVSFYV